MAKIIKLHEDSRVTPDNSIGVPAAVVGGDLVTVTGTQTLTNKTLTNPTVNAASGTVVIPTAASPAQTAEGSIVWDSDDDLLTVGDGSARKTMCDTAGTQTLTNKTLTSPTINGATIATSTFSDTKYATATFTATSGDTGTTLTNVTGLTGFNLTASGVYEFIVDLQTVCTVNGGISVAFKYTTATVSAMQMAIYTGAAASMVEARSTTTADATKYVDNKAAAWLHIVLTGTLTVGTGGTVAIQAAQNTSHADATSVYIGSKATFRRIA